MSDRKRMALGDDLDGKDVPRNGGKEFDLSTLPNSLLHQIFVKLIPENLMDAVHLGACSKQLMAAFRSTPTLDITGTSCRNITGGHRGKAIFSLVLKAKDPLSLQIPRRYLNSLFFALHHVTSLEKLVVQNDPGNTEDFAEKYLTLLMILPRLTTLCLKTIWIGALPAHGLHKLTNLQLMHYRPVGAGNLADLLEDLPLLKTLRVTGNGAWNNGEELIIRHSSLENISIENVADDSRDMAILATPSLRKLCLNFDGRLYLEMPKHITSVHMERLGPLRITGGGRKARASYLAAMGISGPKSAASILLCEECDDHGCSSSVSVPHFSLEDLFLEGGVETNAFGDVEALFADSSRLDFLRLLVGFPGDQKRPLGPFPTLKTLCVSLAEDVLELFEERSLPILEELYIRVEEYLLVRTALKNLDVLLGVPMLRSVRFVVSESLCLPTWFLEWSARIMRRHQHVDVHFQENIWNACDLCG